MIKHENNIKQMIVKSGLKAKYVAEKLGCHPSEISHWAKGRRPFKESVCRQMAVVLKCKKSDLDPKYKNRSSEYRNDTLTISNLLDVLGVDYNSEWVRNKLQGYDLGLDTAISDRKFFKLRTKMKGIK